MYMELGSECSVSDPETDTRCAGPGDRIVPIASATRASHRISPVIASIYQSWAQKNPENATGMAEDAQSERQARAAAHANTSIM